MSRRAALLLPVVCGCFSAFYDGRTSANGPEVLWESDWRTGEVRDGNKWTNSSGALAVVDAGPLGYPALRVPGDSASLLELTGLEPLAADSYLRFYLMNEEPPVGDHFSSGTQSITSGRSLDVFRSPRGGGTTLILGVGSGYRQDGGEYVTATWTANGALENGVFYRVELQLDFVDPEHVKVHPRVFEPSGELKWDDDDFRQADFGSSAWMGDDAWTLASFYARGGTFQVDPAQLKGLWLGSQNPSGTGPWYFAGFQVTRGGWPGPLK